MKNIMVCVTLQNTCRNLINHAVNIKEDGDLLYVLHVAKNGQSFMGAADEAATLEFLYSASHEAKADMTVIHSDNVANTIAQFIKEKDIHTVILGMPSSNSKDNGFIASLKAKLNDSVELIFIDKQKGDLN